MANQSGSVYGLTILSPIKSAADADAEVSPALAIRAYLQTLPQDPSSPFAKVSSTHMARLVVMDDVVYVGSPSHEEHLQAQYLIFESNFDGALDTYLARLAHEAAAEVDAVWRNCDGYPGLGDVNAFIAYMKRCQIETTFYFADVNDKTVQQTLRALQTQSSVAAFIDVHQGKAPEELQGAFARFLETLGNEPLPAPGSAVGKEFTDELL